MSKVNLLAAFAVSLFLHIAVFALLNKAMHSNPTVSGRPGGSANAPLTVTIAKPEKHNQLAAIPEVPRKPASDSGVHPLKNSVPSLPAALFHKRYFSASELDVIPRIRQDIELYPEELQRLKQGGKVVLSLWIDETGHVEKVELVRSELPPIFAEVAMRSFTQASFIPGKKNNLAVKSKVEAVLVFPSHDM